MDSIRRHISTGSFLNDEYRRKYFHRQYFTIEALENGLTAKLSKNACEYRINNGSWQTLAAGSNTISINKGQTLSFRGNLTPNSSSGIGTFTISKQCNLSGNIMSLLYGEDFINKNDLIGKDYAFYSLFQGCENIINTEELILPAIILSASCYRNMFYDCINLITAPELPAMNLAEHCYRGMFYYCSLTTAPKLPAIRMAPYCYYYMFRLCKFIEAPQLPSMNLAEHCYQGIFIDCKSLTKAPELPATTLAHSCYRNMFMGCDNLRFTPELPAKTLEPECYAYMFYTNNGSKRSPVNYIKMLATDISASNCLLDWVNNVSSTGTFVKHPNMNSLSIGNSGIPSGWGIAYNNSGFCIVNPNTSKNVVFYDQYGNLYTPSNKAKNLYDNMSISGIMSLKPECDIKVTVVVDEKDVVIKNQLWSNTQDFYKFSGISIASTNGSDRHKQISITINEIISPAGGDGY